MRQSDRIVANAVANYALTIVQMVGTMVMVPIVVHVLGKAGYGLASMMLSIVAIVDLLCVSITRALQRQVPHCLEGSQTEANRFFNTAMLGFLLVGGISATAVWLLGDWLLAGSDRMDAAVNDGRVALQILAFFLLLGVPGTAYRAVLESLQRYDRVSLYTASAVATRTVLVILVFWAGYGRLSLFVGLNFAATLATLLLCRRWMFKGAPFFRESPALVTFNSAKLIGRFASYTALGLVGNILGTEGFRVFVGKRLGLEDLGAFAAVLTIANLMWVMINNFSSVLTPAVSSMDAHGSVASIAKLLLTGSKYASIVAATVCVVPAAVAGSFLRLWLGPQFGGLTGLAMFVLFSQVFLCVAITPQQVLLGLGHVHRTGFILFFRGLLGLLLAYAYVELIAPDMVGAVVCLYAVRGLGAIELLLYAARMTGVPRMTAVVEVLGRPVALAVPAAAITWILMVQIGADRWWKLACCAGPGEVVFLVLLWLWGISKEERTHVWRFLARLQSRLGYSPVSAGPGGKPR